MNIELIIADDHQLFIDGLKSILSKELDIQIIGQANNGLEVIKLIESGKRPNILLTDIRMPIVDGIALTKMISKEYPDIQVLAVTMFDQSIDVVEMLDAGAKGFVTKNVKKSELVQAIHTLMNGGFYFSENLPKDIQKWFDTEHKKPESTLTRREKEILQLLAKGRTTLQMAQELKISKYTIDTHRKNIHKKLGIKTNTGLVNFFLKNKSVGGLH